MAVKRFDRAGGQRLHALSAKVALKAAGEPMGYPELAQVLRQRGVVAGGRGRGRGRGRAQMQELFRRMVFNILIDNTDDHEKNHALLMNKQGDYTLSLAFDVLPTSQALGYQQLRVGRDMGDATLANALSEHPQFGLKRDAAEDQVRQVASVVRQWKPHFAAAGVRDAHIQWLAQQIDRPFLADQRDAWSSAG